jgi:hypothetical protein
MVVSMEKKFFLTELEKLPKEISGTRAGLSVAKLTFKTLYI